MGITATNSISTKIAALESVMLDMEQRDAPARHIFGDGIYIREVTLKAGSYAIGHYQKTAHVNIMLTGRVTMIRDDGSQVELVAPLTFIGSPGRKVGYIHEDTVWQNVYCTHEQNVDVLEKTYLEKSDEFLNHQKHNLIEKTGYSAFLLEKGISQDIATDQTENKQDQIPLPWGAYKFAVKKSNLHGIGLIASSDIEAGEVIAAARIGDKRTPVGRYTNHSDFPNSIMVAGTDGNIYLVATKKINGCVGGMDGEEILCDYRDSINAATTIKEKI